MHISIWLFFGLLIGVAAIGFLAGYFLNSFFRDMERADVQILEKGIIERDNEIKGLMAKQ